MNFNWTDQPAFQEEMNQLESMLRSQFPGDGPLMKQMSNHVIAAGGKRLRPALVIASAMTGTYDASKARPLAAAIEVLHTATLVHDDVIDGADMRRGTSTLSAEHGNRTAILTGDYLLSRALVLVSKVQLPTEHLTQVARAIESMCAGEVAQHYLGDQIPGTRTYFKRIMQKTSLMFATACSLGAYVGGQDDPIVRKMSQLGLYLGTAFQIRDDLIDIQDDADSAGKNTGTDLVNGIVTLPVLIAAQDAGFRLRLQDYLQGQHTLKQAQQLMDDTRQLGGYDGARQSFDTIIKRCHRIMNALPGSAGKDILTDIVNRLTE